MTELKVIEGTLIGKEYKPGISFDFKISLPLVECDALAVLVEHDGQNDANVNAMLRLADEGKAPYCISIGVMPGKIQMPDGTERGMRMNSYDLFDREYGDFIVFELLPYISETYAVKIAESPDMHMVSGGSSGGISAFVMAWFHSDYFHRVYMSSPSFLAMGRGNEIPYLIRKYETKPLRIYEEYSENEPNDYFGWSRAVDEEAREALLFAGYDFKFSYFSEEGHCSRYHDLDEAYKRGEWIWRDWQSEKITAPRNSPRVDQVIPPTSKWEKCDSFPKKERDFTPMALSDYEHVVLSNDGQAFYAANSSDDIVYMYVNDDAISKEKGILQAALHTIPRFDPRGAIDIAIDRADRLFVLTSIGIQCVRSFGLIDVILDLPDSAKPLKIAITDALYVETKAGIYRRVLNETSTKANGDSRKFISYYD
ncbi:MAG: hypothetical protein IJ412_06070 [Oscillospiraceae bacterium]|nr:hypothetical protein [Oscillospiraceae bacterium]